MIPFQIIKSKTKDCIRSIVPASSAEELREEVLSVSINISATPKETINKTIFDS